MRGVLEQQLWRPAARRCSCPAWQGAAWAPRAPPALAPSTRLLHACCRRLTLRRARALAFRLRGGLARSTAAARRVCHGKLQVGAWGALRRAWWLGMRHRRRHHAAAAGAAAVLLRAPCRHAGPLGSVSILWGGSRSAMLNWRPPMMGAPCLHACATRCCGGPFMRRTGAGCCGV